MSYRRFLSFRQTVSSFQFLCNRWSNNVAQFGRLCFTIFFDSIDFFIDKNKEFNRALNLTDVIIKLFLCANKRWSKSNLFCCLNALLSRSFHHERQAENCYHEHQLFRLIICSSSKFLNPDRESSNVGSNLS